MGKKPPKKIEAEEKQQIGARIPVGIYDRLRHHGIERRAKVGALLAEAIDEYLRKRGA